MSPDDSMDILALKKEKLATGFTCTYKLASHEFIHVSSLTSGNKQSSSVTEQLNSLPWEFPSIFSLSMSLSESSIRKGLYFSQSNKN